MRYDTNCVARRPMPISLDCCPPPIASGSRARFKPAVVLLLPFGLLDSTGVMTPVIVIFIAYMFFALEALGAEI